MDKTWDLSILKIFMDDTLDGKNAEIVLCNGRKHCRKFRKYILQAVFSFSHNDF